MKLFAKNSDEDSSVAAEITPSATSVVSRYVQTAGAVDQALSRSHAALVAPCVI
jgi:hypothetical protein